MSDKYLLVISSDGHVSPPMAEYRPYMEAKYLSQFDEFLIAFNEHGSRTGERRNLAARLNQDALDEWSEKMLDTGRWENFHNPDLRLKETEQEGVAAEVLFPDFGGMPFELTGSVEAILRAESGVKMSFDNEELLAAGKRAYNRWLIDFTSTTPDRYFGQALIGWTPNIDEAIAEMRWAREAGIRGVILPKFTPEQPLFHADFDPVWNALDDLDMVVNSHAGASSTASNSIRPLGGAPHPALTVRASVPERIFHNRNLLSHLVWGGVLERHPNLKFVFTEVGSAWTVSELQSMDHTYRGSYFRSDYKDVIKHFPSEYFHRQCFLGSSIFSRGEIARRHEIGIDKMMIGMDFPHHEGTLLVSTQDYLRATFGAEKVPEDEARLMLGLNAAKVFGFDVERLAPAVERIALRPDEVLTPPERDLYVLGDVHRPDDGHTL
jgi:predicted TIM-barrel fold metal-dependent hydrolase